MSESPPLNPVADTLTRVRDAPRAWLIAVGTVFVTSVALRIALATSITPVLVSDARDYHVLARNLAEGRGYVQIYEGETDAFQEFTFRAFRPPGYPMLLAGLYTLFGWHSAAYLTANVVADAVTQLAALLIALHLLGRGPALLTQLLLALHVLWTPNPMTESTYTALFVVLVGFIVFGAPFRSWSAAALFGVIAAAALFIRPITVCLFLVLGWHWLRHYRAARPALMLGLTLAPSIIALGIWAARNYALFDQVVLFTTNFGHHNAYDYGIHGDRVFAELRAQGLNEAEINQALIRLEWERATRYPLAWTVTIAERAAGLFSLRPAWEVKNVLWEAMWPGQQRGSLAGRLYRASYWQYYATYPLAALGGIVVLVQRRRMNGLWTVAIGYVIVHALVSRGDIRLAAPLYPLLCVFAAAIASLPLGPPRRENSAPQSANGKRRRPDRTTPRKGGISSQPGRSQA